MYKSSVVLVYLNGQLIIHVILYFVCKVIRWVFLTFVVPFCCVTHRSHAIYTAVSRYGVISLVPAPATTFSLPKRGENVVVGAGTKLWRNISFFETPPNLTISFVYIFSRGFKQRISSDLYGFFQNST